MPNIAVVLREEISRLARKEIRSQTEALRKASAQHRKAVADMKRRTSELERKVILLEQQVLRDIDLPPSVVQCLMLVFKPHLPIGFLVLVGDTPVRCEV